MYNIYYIKNNLKIEKKIECKNLKEARLKLKENDQFIEKFIANNNGKQVGKSRKFGDEM